MIKKPLLLRMVERSFPENQENKIIFRCAKLNFLTTFSMVVHIQVLKLARENEASNPLGSWGIRE